jgi:gamma-glutamyl-gamma-aminobutyrate hydrolase PuuD
MLHGIPMGGGGSEIGAAVAPGSRLAEALGTIEAIGVCHHHQAVDRVADDLEVVARAADGTVEGLEPVGTDDWVVAVQWHPEDSSATDPVQRALFTAFTEACRARTPSRADPMPHQEAPAAEGPRAIDDLST